MPDLQNHTLVRLDDPVVVASPGHVLEAKLVEGETVLHDFTGVAAIRFPAVLATLSIAWQNYLVGKIQMDLIDAKAGNPPPQ